MPLYTQKGEDHVKTFRYYSYEANIHGKSGTFRNKKKNGKILDTLKQHNHTVANRIKILGPKIVVK